MKRNLCTLLLAAFGTSYADAQRTIPGAEVLCPPGTGAIRSTVLHNDSACTSFLLCIDSVVRPHLHRAHTEHVFVLEGSAVMLLGDTSRAIAPGDVVLIPRGTPHAVKVTSGGPLKVISVQAPSFDGTDRVWLDER